MLKFSLALFSLLLATTLANFEVSMDSDSYKVGSSITVSWKDDGKTPKIDQYVTADFLLCTFQVAGGQLECPIVLAKKQDITGSTKQTFSIDSSSSGLGGNGEYTVQMAAVGSDPNNYAINYASQWASLSGMTGKQAAVQGQVSPQVVGVGAGGDANTAFGSYTVPASLQGLPSPWMTPYIWQKGPTRYAPFQPTPGSTVTYKLSASRRFDTSSYSPFKSMLNTVLPATTLTPSPSITITQYPHIDNSITVETTGRPAVRVVATAAARRRRWAD